MPQTKEPSASNLRKRIQRFLTSRAYSRHAVRDVIDILAAAGEVGVFGGALRDLALHGNLVFPKDVDVVVTAENKELSKLLEVFTPQRNRYGGFAFKVSNWQFDVWALEDTWAVRKGLVEATHLASLVYTTFFDWDAIVYNVSSRTLTTSADYFDRLSARVLDINLRANPNPIGNAVRALRAFRAGRAALSTSLSEYVLSEIQSNGIEALLSSERGGFANSLLTLEFIRSVIPELRRSIDRSVPLAPPKAEQLGLGLSG